MAQIVDVGAGSWTFNVEDAAYSHDKITMQLSSSIDTIDRYPGTIVASGVLDGLNRLVGEWRSSIGTYGVFDVARRTRISRPNRTVTDAIAESNKAFVMMGFGQSLEESAVSTDAVLHAIQRSCRALSIEAHRADEIEHSGSITDLMVDKIKRYRLLISDLTHERPNVYYEIGYAHGLGKDVILTAYEGTKIHFDIAAYNVIYYGTVDQLEERLRRRLASKGLRLTDGLSTRAPSAITHGDCRKPDVR